MAYTRFSYADIYVYADVNGSLACCGCPLGARPWYFDSTQAMVDHIAEHRAAGHDVPEGLEAELWDDDESNFPPSCREGHDWGEPYRPYADAEGFVRNITRRDCTRCGWTR